MRAIDIDDETDALNLIKEIETPTNLYKTVWRQNRRYIEMAEKVDINNMPI